MKKTLCFIRNAGLAATIKGHGSKADFLAGRIVQAATSRTLVEFGERLCSQLGVDPALMSDNSVSGFFSNCQKQSSIAHLQWLRKYPKMAAMICFLAQSDFDEAISQIGEIEAFCDSDVAVKRPDFDLSISFELVSPLAHGADQKAGNCTLFRRQEVCGVNGNIMRLPFYSGNAIRGKIRDLLADDLLLKIGLGTSRAKPSVSLWFFHSLYAGGALEENSPATKAIAKKCGDNGGIKAEGIYEFRDNIPSLSVLGCAFGNRIISGRAQVSDLRPRCKEWGTGHVDSESLFDWLFLTRRDDHEGHANGENKSMIANTEVLKPGTILDGGFDISSHASELEKSAFLRGVKLLANDGYLGAESRRGFGKSIVSVSENEGGELWSKWVDDNRKKIIDYLNSVKAIATIRESDAVQESFDIEEK